jgi:alpha-glucosidase
MQLTPNINDSAAKDAQQACPGYTADNVKTTSLGLTATLTLSGNACNVYGTDTQSLALTVEYQSTDRLNVEIVPSTIPTNSSSNQYIIPESLVAKPTAEPGASAGSANDLQFDYGNTPSFWFRVTRKSNGDVLFSTMGNKLVFENQFIEFKSNLPSDYNIYGLGETIHSFKLGPGVTRTLYASDSADIIDSNLYGTHPVYIDTRYFSTNSSGKPILVTGDSLNDPAAQLQSLSHGVYLRNAHGQEVLLEPGSITWRTLGGVVDLYFYSGPTAPAVIKSYQTTATGLPALQQYWTLGFHQCRWGYKSWNDLQAVVDGYENAGIPLESIWTDIDYMDKFRDFTTDPVNFPVSGGQAFLNKLQQSGRHYVPIIDSAIYVPNPNNQSDAYDFFDKGNASGVFLKNPDGSVYIGQVWPGYTAFPDWLAPNTGKWWTDSLTALSNNIKFDGIWIDMSEASSFCIGSCGTGKLGNNPVHVPFALPGEPGNVIYDYPEGFAASNATEAAAAASASAAQIPAASTPMPVAAVRTETLGTRNLDYPPYIINNVQDGHDLAAHAVAPDATHADGTVEYDFHNLFGHQILNATYQSLLSINPGKRPFIIGRSTFVGSGKYAGHWGGDNASKWYYMYYSIPQALSMSIFGLPMFGVDTCGFTGNSDAELCNRWMQLSAFFPFYRNHNVISANSQEAFIWSSVAQATRDAMQIRGLLLPYMYTLMYNAHSAGETVMRALAWEFPSEPLLAGADRQFLLGPAIMVTPVLTPGASSVSGVFPGVGTNQVWYDWYTQTAVTATLGQNVSIPAPLGHIPVYVRGGYVLPLQQPAMTTTLARQNPYALLVALAQDGTANGTLYVDDGETLNPTKLTIVSFAAAKGTLSATIAGNYSSTNPLANITILGVQAAPSKVTFGGKTITSTTYDSTSKILTVTGLSSKTSSGAWTGDGWKLSWEGGSKSAASSQTTFVELILLLQVLLFWMFH